MKRRTAAIIIIAIVAAVSLGLFLIVRGGSEAKYERDLQDQLRLARAEGIPTTWLEYGRQIKPVPPESNAALLYKRLSVITYGTLGRIDETTRLLLANPDSAGFAAAKKLLDDNARAMMLLDAGAKMPHCWFDRDWSKGFAVPQNDAHELAHASILLELRAAVAAANGDQAKAVSNIDQEATIARQLDEEGSLMSYFGSRSAYDSAVRLSAELAFRYGTVDAYSEELTKLVTSWPRTDIRPMMRGDLLQIFDLLTLSTTSAGRKELGMEDKDVPPMESVNPWLLSRTKARTDIVRAERAIWQDLDLPYRQRKAQIGQAIKVIERAMAAYPTALVAYLAIAQPDAAQWMLDLRAEAQRLLYEAAARALTTRTIPKSIKTDDLLSPFDGTPAKYSYDGKQITITVSDPEKDGGSITLQIPRKPPASPTRPRP